MFLIVLHLVSFHEQTFFTVSRFLFQSQIDQKRAAARVGQKGNFWFPWKTQESDLTILQFYCSTN